jgi:hypothetical protein
MTYPHDPSAPCPYINTDFTVDYSIYKGLTKREYFAAMAMQGLISNLSAYVQVHQKSSGHELIYPNMDTAVIIADALIAELNK